MNSKPLTEEQKDTLIHTGSCHALDIAIESALARLDYLERKVQAADKIRDHVLYGDGGSLVRAATAYDEVQP